MISFAANLLNTMNAVSMFGRKLNLKYFSCAAYEIGNQYLKLTSLLNSPIVLPQYKYAFAPTTQRQIII